MPFRGEVDELKIVGNGKDCSLQLRLSDGLGFGSPLARDWAYHARIKCGEGIEVLTSGEDDVSLTIRYRAQPGWRMRVVRVELLYPGTDEEWEQDCAIWARMTRAEWPAEGMRGLREVDIELAAAPAPQR